MAHLIAFRPSSSAHRTARLGDAQDSTTRAVANLRYIARHDTDYADYIEHAVEQVADHVRQLQAAKVGALAQLPKPTPAGIRPGMLRDVRRTLRVIRARLKQHRRAFDRLTATMRKTSTLGG